MRESHRKAMLFAVLAGVVAVIFLDPSHNENRGRSRPPGSPPAQNDVVAVTPGPKGEPASATLSLPERPALGEPAGELFGSQSWQPPAPKITAAPGAPSAPPMPYRFAGKLVQDGKLQVFLSKGDLAIPISQGGILDGAYRVESIGANGITLVYLPLGHKESIPVSSSLPTAGATAQTVGVTAATGAPHTGIGTIPTASVIAPAAATSPRPQAIGEAVGAAAEQKSGSKPARLLWEGPQNVKPGVQFSVALRVISDQPVRASPMQVRFDPTVLESVGVRPGKFYGAEAGRGFSYRVNPDGSIFIGAANQGPASSPDMELLVLTFKPIKPGSTAELAIISLTLEGAAGRTIAFDSLAAFKTAITP